MKKNKILLLFLSGLLCFCVMSFSNFLIYSFSFFIKKFKNNNLQFDYIKAFLDIKFTTTFSIINFKEDINVKDTFDIETSGVSDIFPRGLKIGTFYIKELNAFKQIKEMRFKPSYNIYDIQSVLVYKWSKNNFFNQEIQKQIDIEIEEEYKKNKGTTQAN